MSRRNPVTGIVQPHWGIDLVGFDPIHSPVAGIVTFAGYNGGAGIEVRIREWGTNDVIRLLHNRALNVRAGNHVGEGTVVAWMGSTGQSTGPHCHEETRPGGGQAIDPNLWYSWRNAQPAGKPTEPKPEIKRRKQDMIHAAWRDDNGSIAIQTQPRGRITLISDWDVWAGITQATGAAFHQISNAKMQELLAFYGRLPYAAFDMEHASGMSLIHDQGSQDVYLLTGAVLVKCVEPVKTIEQLQGRVPEYWLPTAEIDNLRNSLT